MESERNEIHPLKRPLFGPAIGIVGVVFISAFDRATPPVNLDAGYVIDKAEVLSDADDDQANAHLSETSTATGIDL